MAGSFWLSGLSAVFSASVPWCVWGRRSISAPQARKTIPDRMSPVENPQAAAIPPIASGAKAAMPRPMLKQNPAPVVRILVGLDQRGDLFLYAEQRPSIGFTGDRGVDDSVAGSRFEVPPFLLQRTGFGEGAGALDA